jgi:hypothetical protein
LGNIGKGDEMKILAAMILTTAFVAGCSDPQSATRALESQGFKNIKITGYAWLGCSEDDAWRTGFEADALSGRRVAGVVCSGIFKGSTVRTF